MPIPDAARPFRSDIQMRLNLAWLLLLVASLGRADRVTVTLEPDPRADGDEAHASAQSSTLRIVNCASDRERAEGAADACRGGGGAAVRLDVGRGEPFLLT